MFLWRILANAIPTREMTVNRLGNGEIGCPLCGAEVETAFHLFKLCPWIRVIAFGSKWGCYLDLWEVDNIQDLIHGSINPTEIPCFKNMEPHFVTILLSSLFYVVWRSRNLLIHQYGWNVDEAIKNFECQVLDFAVSGTTDAEGYMDPFMVLDPPNLIERWIPPPYGWIKINSKAALSKEGSAVAFIARDINGEVIKMASKLTDLTSVFEAGLEAVAWAANYAAKMNWNNIFWSMDAAGVVREINSKEDPKGWTSRYTM